MIGFPWLSAAALVLGLVAICLVLLARRLRAQPPAAPAPASIYEEAPILPVNQPWSPTRGVYTFKVADLPAIYHGLPSLAERELVSQFADFEDDARRELTKRLIEEHFAQKRTGSVELVKTPAIAFKALIRRKGNRA